MSDMTTHHGVAGAGRGQFELMQTLNWPNSGYGSQALIISHAGQPRPVNSFDKIFDDYLKKQAEQPEQVDVDAFIDNLEDQLSGSQPLLRHFFESSSSQQKTRSIASYAGSTTPDRQGACLSSKRRRDEDLPSGTKQPQHKKVKTTKQRDASPASLETHERLQDHQLFDMIEIALKCPDAYEDLLRCLILLYKGVFHISDVLKLVQPLLKGSPELYLLFKRFLDQKNQDGAISLSPRDASCNSQDTIDVETGKPDYGSYPRYEDSTYVILPESYVAPKCSGRDLHCDEVLNDTYVAVPRWIPTETRRTNSNPGVKACWALRKRLDDLEDERFEFDRVMMANAKTIEVLQTIQDNLSQMTAEEAARFTLDDTLGGTSQYIHRKAIERIYGESAPTIIDSLKKNASTTVPLVLRQLLAKNKEWEDEKKKLMTKLKEKTQECYLRSCDQQSHDFKRNDCIALLPRTLLDEICSVHRNQRCKERFKEPHLTLRYAKIPVLNHGFELIMHRLEGRLNCNGRLKKQMRFLLHHHIQEMLRLMHPEFPESDGVFINLDIADNGSDEHIQPEDESPPLKQSREKFTPSCDSSLAGSNANKVTDDYNVFYADSHWYLFFRLFYILTYRLNTIYEEALILIEDEATCKMNNQLMLAAGVKEKPKCNVRAADRYLHFLTLVKKRLDKRIALETFERRLKRMFGTNGYIAFTLDEVIKRIVNELQNISGSEVSLNLMKIFLEEHQSGAAGLNRMAYEGRAEVLCTGYCYQIKTMKKDRLVEITVLDSETRGTQKAEVNQTIDPVIAEEQGL